MIMLCSKKSQAAFEYIILLGIFLSMTTLVILYSNNEIKNYVERAELEDNLRTVIKSAETVAAEGAGASKVIQIEMPKGVAQAYASGNDVVLRMFTEGDYLSDIHYFSDVKIFGKFEAEEGVKQLVLTAQKSGFVSISPLMSPTLMDHVIAYYDMDYRNSTYILDVSGKSPAARINGSDCSVEGVVGKGCNMTITNHYLIIPNFNLSYDKMSYSVWFKPSDATAGRIIEHTWYGGCNAGSEGMLSVEMQSGNVNSIFCQLNNTSGPYINGYSSILLDVWHNLIVTFEDGVMKQYVDGMLDGSYSGDSLLRKKSATLYIGSQGGSTFQGVIDDVIFFDKALTADEVKKVYTIGRNDQ